ncbi:MAG: hypothetical protein JXR31_00055, partial [Prolixibacteraceae bacterium]|nr:hypothetical protein [Prolixibacteraceae bacterium]
IYIQDRQGQTRVTHNVSFENSRNPVILNLDGTPKMVVTDINGGVYYLYFNGNFIEKETPGFSKNHFFNIDDINGDGNPEFIFIDKDELTVLNETGKKLFSETFKNEIFYGPDIYNFSSTVKKIGVVDKIANRIYLFNPDGSLHKGFPLQGNSEFSIGKISDGTGYLNLIVGSNNGSIYNYRLD